MNLDVKHQLVKLGLSVSQAEVYALLANSGELRVQEIANHTKIPRSSVYEILRVLENKGLIERVVSENYVRIRSYPLDSMRNNLNQQIAELQELTNSLNELEKAMAELPAMQSTSIKIRYYKGKAGARQIFWNSLKTDDMIYVLSSFGRSQFVGKKFYMNFVAESFKRQIREQVITNPTERALGLIKRDNGTPLARTDGSNIRLLSEKQIHIHGDTLIYGNIYAHLYFDDDEINGFEIESKHFAQTQRAIFETLWQSAIPLDK